MKEGRTTEVVVLEIEQEKDNAKKKKMIKRSSFTPSSGSENEKTPLVSCPALPPFQEAVLAEKNVLSDSSEEMTWAPPILCCSKELCSYYDKETSKIVTDITCRARCDTCKDFCHRRCVTFRSDDTLLCLQCYYE